MLRTGATSSKSLTDSTGQATAEVFEKSPAPGTNQIGIQVIRPAGSPGAAGRAITVGSGSALQTWTASGISLRTSGPAQAGVGATVTYRIEVSNPGSSVASGVVVTDEAPAGLTYLNSNPAASSSPTGARVAIGRFAGRRTRTIEVDFRVDRAGSFNYCAAFTGDGGLAGRDCVSTVAAAGQLNVSILGPPTAEVGGQVTYTIDIANQSDATLTHVVVSDRFDPGLEHAVATGAIERDLQDEIPPRQSRQLAVTFRVAQPGQLCQDVTITAEGGLRGEAHNCLTVPNRQAAAAAAAVVPPGETARERLLRNPPTAPPSCRPADRPGPDANRRSRLETAGGLTVQVSGPTAQVGRNRRVRHHRHQPRQRAVDERGRRQQLRNQSRSEPRLRPARIRREWSAGLDARLAGPRRHQNLAARIATASKRPAKACNRVTVTADGGLLAGDEACLEIYTTDAAAGPRRGGRRAN